jgi:hypothetical protein
MCPWKMTFTLTTLVPLIVFSPINNKYLFIFIYFIPMILGIIDRDSNFSNGPQTMGKKYVGFFLKIFF